ncbi:MAG: hypothetical protein IKZ13_09480 [Akkermansia sp.]|nr:hypothetical protein [Akkermansia sp.]
MKVRNALLAAALVMPAMAGTEAPIIETVAPAPAANRLKGSVTFGYDSNYTGRGYVVSHSVAQGDSVGYGALKTNYDIGKPGGWTLGFTMAYTAPMSGHTLYGNPRLGGNNIVGTIPHPLDKNIQVPVTGEQAGAAGKTIGEKNIENQFSIIADTKYTSQSELWNVTFGYHYNHGGLLGVMAKHYRGRGASSVNELFVTPEWTPHKALAIGMKTSASVGGLSGWWFEPYVTAKAPIIGTPEDLTLLGMVTVGATFSSGIFADIYEACGNGMQAIFVKFSTPWFVTDNFIITPSVSFNWLGNGGNDANRRSKVRYATGNSTMIPFKDFAVVAGVSATYTF